jgi:hypothetical protein
MKRYCIECGEQISNDSKFCPTCGKKQGESETLLKEKPENKKIIVTADEPIRETMQNENILAKSELELLIGWIALHSIALLTSYGEIEGFNERGWHSARTVWPFHTQWFWCNSYGMSTLIPTGTTCESNGGVLIFNGLFTAYDITDFLLYIGLSLFLILFVFINRKK